MRSPRTRKDGFLVPRPKNASALSDDDLVHYVIQAMQKTVDFYKDREVLRSTLDHATIGQQALFALWWTKTEIDNGGFHQYFYNPTGLLSQEALAGYRLVGAAKFAKLHERAIRLFPDELPPESKARRRVVERLPKEPFDELSDEFYRLNRKANSLLRLCADYVRAHPDDFFEHEQDRAERH